MNQTRRILVGIDLSTSNDRDDLAADALRSAFAMASASGGTEVVIAYVEPGARNEKHALALGELLDRLRDRVESALQAFRAAHPDAPVPPARSEVVVGDPAKELVRLSQQLGAGLVVVATHDRKGIQRAVLGSVAAEVLERCTCPVLILKPIAHPKVEPLAEIQAPSHRPIHIHAHAYHHEGASVRAMRPWGFGF